MIFVFLGWVISLSMIFSSSIHLLGQTLEKDQDCQLKKDHSTLFFHVSFPLKQNNCVYVCVIVCVYVCDSMYVCNCVYLCVIVNMCIYVCV